MSAPTSTPRSRSTASTGAVTSPWSNDRSDRPVLLRSPPFSLPLTVAVLRRLPGNVLDQWDGATGTYSRALWLAPGPALVGVRQVNARSLELAGEPSAAPLVRRMLGLDVELDLPKLSAAEPRLAPVLRQLRGLRPPRFPSLFETIGLTVPFNS